MVSEGDIGVAADFGTAQGAATAVLDFSVVVVLQRVPRVVAVTLFL